MPMFSAIANGISASYRQPGKLHFSRILDLLGHPRWLLNVLLPGGVPGFENVHRYMPPETRNLKGAVAGLPEMLAGDICWQDVAWIRDSWPGKLIIKGILSVEDARQAARLGCEAIVLSNHGGRQLDYCVSAMDVLPEISRACGDQLEIHVDGGFRRGSEILMALCLGADAVMLGRATLYGLAAGGQAGVDHALKLLKEELARGLGQLGCRSLDDLGPHLITTI